VINPLISIITNVDLAHTTILGNSVQKIAKDKAGIIKQESLVITGAKQPSVQRIISERAISCNAKYFLLGQDFEYKLKGATLTGSVFDFRWTNKIYQDVRLSVPGLFQIENASIALAAAHLLPQLGFKMDQETRHQALEKVKIPGRFEVVQKSPLIILDVAHNMVKLRTFLSSLTYILPRQKFIFVATFVTLEGSKEMEEILKQVTPYAKAFVIVESSQDIDGDDQSATSAAAVAALLKKLNFSGEVAVEKQPRKALDKAKKLANKTGIVVVTGSLYLVGQIRDLFHPQ
jgi:dihydrofolate synthase/folylpolyglutamate synthase